MSERRINENESNHVIDGVKYYRAWIIGYWKIDRRSGDDRRVGDSGWRVAVDMDCEPLSDVAHLMHLCGDEHIEYCEESSRHPLCGQSFGGVWMQDEATDKQRHCKKCEKINKRGD